MEVITGTVGNDTFRASDATYNTGDEVNGGAGTDTLNLVTTAAVTDLVDLNSVENIFLRNTQDAQDIEASGWSGAAQLWYDRGTEDLTLSDVAEIATVGIKEGAGADSDYTVTYAAAAVSGAADTQAVVLQAADVDDLTIDGIEVMNISSTTGANTVATIITDAGTGEDLETVNVTGDQNLTITDALEANVTAVDASALTGAISVEMATVVTASDDSIAFTGGTGDDTLNTGDQLDDGSVNADATIALDGGDGTDILAVDAQIDSDVTVDGSAQITNFEVLQIEADVAYDLDGYDWVEQINLNADIGGGGAARVIDNIAGTTTTNLIVSVTDAELSHVDAGGVGTQSISASIGGDAAVTATTLTIDGVENISIESTGEAANTITAMENDTLRTLTITGDQDLTITAENIADGVAASAFTGGLDIDLSAQTTAISVVTGSGDDTVTIDTVDALAHDVTTGAGSDTIEILNVNGGATETIANRIQISDFTVGDTGDTLDLSSGAGTIATDAELADIQTAVDALATGSTVTDALGAAIGAFTAAANDVYHFEFGGSTFVVYEEGATTGTTGAFDDGNDFVIELTGTTGFTAADDLALV